MLLWIPLDKCMSPPSMAEADVAESVARKVAEACCSALTKEHTGIAAELKDLDLSCRIVRSVAVDMAMMTCMWT